MSVTPHLALPLLTAAQAQKHVTHNEALASLDALVHLAVKEQDRLSPPSGPEEGERYLVGEDATGDFAQHDGEVAFFELGVWRFLVPQAGWRAYVEAEDRLVVYDGATWHDLGHYTRILDNIAKLGVGTAADAVNRFAAKSNAALFTALNLGEGGTGDMRFVLNKEASGNALSQLYQRNFSGRAETGLVGNDDYTIKVSPDGATWRDALVVDRASAEVTLPGSQGGLRNLFINSEFTVNQRVFAGGALAVGIYGFDRWRGGTGGCTLTRAADGTVTLSGALVQVLESPGLAGQVVTVSVENPTASLNVNIAGATAMIPAGSGRRGATLTVPAAATGNVAILISATSATFARPMMTRGVGLHGFERLPFALTLMLCQRYYEKSYDLATAPGTATTAGVRLARAIVANQFTLDGFLSPFTVRKRTAPLITWFSPTGVAARVRDFNSNADIVVNSTSGSGEIHTGAPVLAAAAAIGGLFQAHWTAEAEL